MLYFTRTIKKGLYNSVLLLMILKMEVNFSFVDYLLD